MLKHAVDILVLGRTLLNGYIAVLGKQSRPRVFALWTDAMFGEEYRLNSPCVSDCAYPAPVDVLNDADCPPRTFFVPLSLGEDLLDIEDFLGSAVEPRGDRTSCVSLMR